MKTRLRKMLHNFGWQAVCGLSWRLWLKLFSTVWKCGLIVVYPLILILTPKWQWNKWVLASLYKFILDNVCGVKDAELYFVCAREGGRKNDNNNNKKEENLKGKENKKQNEKWENLVCGYTFLKHENIDFFPAHSHYTNSNGPRHLHSFPPCAPLPLHPPPLPLDPPDPWMLLTWWEKISSVFSVPVKPTSISPSTYCLGNSVLAEICSILFE